jgi:hypothetical protein
VTGTKPLPTFKFQARPLCVPPEIATMAPSTEIKVIGFVGGGVYDFQTQTAADYVQELQATIARQATGYFTVDEAAQILADNNPGEVEAKPMIQQMLAAFRGGNLPIRNTGDKLQPLDKDEVRSYVNLVTIGDVNKWLEENGSPHRIPESPAPSISDESSEVRPVQRSKAQEDAILAKIQTNGHDPLKLVKNQPGKPGVKAEIRTALGSSGMWAGQTVFNKAWERLLRNGTIAYRTGVP